ncbi:large ribosomal subunit protein bL21m-like isoform X2 [Ylistrum balloti]|uniref:large ribosomal subunit protein bL21m-like isoform X2 n=1 Tax=Ylistrum balloti TaxID=509963 RepID=UPI002905D2C0|nr:large ribosomal subunit protein bL21m-like isoform X2 [Ylistrum balloti]
MRISLSSACSSFMQDFERPSECFKNRCCHLCYERKVPCWLLQYQQTFPHFKQYPQSEIWHSCRAEVFSRTAVDLVNETLASEDLGRLFAVVQVAGKQRKVTTEDVIIVEAYFPPTVGDRIRLEKVLLVGGKDFTLMGMPMLSRQQVCVEATVIEKTLSHYKINFGYKRRHRHSHFKLTRNQQTVLLINSIEVNRSIEY